MIELDGAEGEGGGQILRTALGLSVLTGTPFRIHGIRGKRRRPGLMRQHLTCVQAAARISHGRVEGATPGSQELVFEPQGVEGGDYHFAIGTAGSTTLVLQTILPPLLRAGRRSTVVIEGGTHNPLAPPVEFIERVFLHQLERMGASVGFELERYGFYPAGGGRIRVTIDPVERLAPLSLTERGERVGQTAGAIVALISPSIAERELRVVRRGLGFKEDDLKVIPVKDSAGPGNAVWIEVAHANVRNVDVAIGAKAISAEDVAREVMKAARRFLAGEFAVGEYLADQLLIPMAMASGGEFLTGPLSLHATTNMAVVEKFLPVRFSVKTEERRSLVSVHAR